jgi:hypothetical protein
MRFHIFCSPRQTVIHAPHTWLRVKRLREQLAEWVEAPRLPPVALRSNGPASGRIIEILLRDATGRVSPQALGAASANRRRKGFESDS